MTNQEAIKWIDSKLLALFFSADITSKGRRMDLINKEYNAMMLSRAALEKQIPMAPERTIVNNDDMWKKATFQCPRCAAPLFIVEAFANPVCGVEKSKQGARSPFCQSCGQALKWKEE